MDNVKSLDLMPCRILFSGNAKVNEFFTSGITKLESGGLKASYQGYLLHGEEVKVPEGFTGVVLIPAEDTEKGNKFSSTQTFESFRYWNWDLSTSKDDEIQQASTWMKLSKVLMDDSMATVEKTSAT